MTRIEVIEILVPLYGEAAIEDYLHEAEQRKGPSYWQLIPNRETLVADYCMYVEATRDRAESST